MDARARNEAIVRGFVEAELDAARAFLDGHLAHMFHGRVLGRLGNALALGLWHAIGEHEVRKRIHRQFELTAAAARDAGTYGLAAAIERHVGEAVAHEEIVHRGDRAHPAFADLERRLREAFARRTEALAPLFAFEGPATTYADLVRGAYPDPTVPREALAWQLAHARVVTDVVRSDPRILRFPAPLLRHLFPLIDEATSWYEAHATAELDAVYRPAPPGPP